MEHVKKLIRRTSDGRLCFWCPGCKCAHGITIPGWSFNADYERPTFTPSVLVTSGHYSNRFGLAGCWCKYNEEHKDNPAPFKCGQCHTFVTDGRIHFLPDCTHELAGKTVDLEPF